MTVCDFRCLKNTQLLIAVCCYHCGKHNGHYEKSEFEMLMKNNPEISRKIQQMMETNQGACISGVGCAIPRQYRSKACIGKCCGSIKSIAH